MQAYMSVGQIAKKMGVTVRTMQYYDREGVLRPSAESEGGRRLYTNKDIVKLHQIQMMKYLGFSLEDIKNRLPVINTTREVSRLLKEQAKGIREKIKTMKKVLVDIEKLENEVIQMDTVDWTKYADITVMLMHDNEGYWVMKYMKDAFHESLTQRFSEDEGSVMQDKYKAMIRTAVRLQEEGHPPDSEVCLAFAKEWWDFTTTFTKDDPVALNSLIQVGGVVSEGDWKKNFKFDKAFIEGILGAYFEKTGIDPYKP